MSKRKKKQKRQDDILFYILYGLCAVAIISVIIATWYIVYRANGYYSVPFYRTGEWLV